MQMKIADFWHAEGLPDLAVQSTRFRSILKAARLVGDDFNPPSRNSVGGDLLTKNYKTYKQQNKSLLLKEASVSGIAWMGDGATMARMPLVNVLAMCAAVPPVVIAINDCTGHMSKGRKKDATYISKMFEADVCEYDEDKLFTDIFL